MTPKAKRQALLVGGVVVVVGAVYTNRPTGVPASGSAPPSKSVAAAAQQGKTIPVEDVQLELLRAQRSEMNQPERNPFRFQPKAAPPAPPRRTSATPPPPVSVAPPVPQGPPPPPPIPLRFIGVVEAPAQAGRVAILSDGRGNVFYGKEGDIIEGRYRLLRVAPDAADIAFIDGRGRQTLRLSGQ
jgi:hypothetical protein